mmetsp:Transcript_81269/g.169828  ORF Transcript_81269/g.169828 Transcript_81269/m.169828 type:complete len:155 (-) Transcript_81269:1513-1977(-)
MAINSECVPFSTFTPALMTKITEELRIVESRCAMVMVVRPSEALLWRSSRAACTLFSDSLSKADVASSNKSSWGFLAKARAMATRCFCPPESWPPLMPTKVSIFFGRFSMNPQACAFLRAASAASLEMLRLPPRRFSRMLVAKRTGSWPTYPTS